MDDWLRDAAVILGKTQFEIETEYYLVDLPDLIDAKNRVEAQQRLTSIQERVAANGRKMADEDYSRYRRALLKDAGIKAPSGFDRDKFEELRALTQRGGNKR
jgi:hypothetical protein